MLYYNISFTDQLHNIPPLKSATLACSSPYRKVPPVQTVTCYIIVAGLPVPPDTLKDRYIYDTVTRSYNTPTLFLIPIVKDLPYSLVE
jgi:hypothetical protein